MMTPPASALTGLVHEIRQFLLLIERRRQSLLEIIKVKNMIFHRGRRCKDPMPSVIEQPASAGREQKDRYDRAGVVELAARTGKANEAARDHGSTRIS